ncbi:MAG: carboxypeptidase-like regulatory domain-containing protein [Ferruginibacter sp.]
MKNGLLKKISFYLMAAALVSSVSFISSCQKELSDPGGIVPIVVLPDLTTKIASTVSGFVTDENNLPVLGATVTAGTATVSTDKYGYFEFKNIQVVKNAAVVTVTKNGYFKGIKTYIATDNKASFVRIKLIPKTTSGTVSAASGGSVTLPNGMKITLPANGVVNTATNTAYTGTVNVAAFWISPTATDLNLIMPGDLRGLNTSGAMQTLTTYGMAAVELTGTGGEILQITTGKKAGLTMPIPSAILGTAPATIPLWHFDEAKGLWAQEGSATKTGTNYEGEVSHFSFWNCDVPANFVQFNCTVNSNDGAPIRMAMVKISEVSNPYNARYGYTDSLGYVAGAIPNNANLLIEVFANDGCNTASFNQTFSTTTTNINFGIITLPATTTAILSGSVVDCGGLPVSNGYIILNKNGIVYRYPLTATGTFNFTTPLCSGATTGIIIAEDLTGAQQSAPQNITISTGNNALGQLLACGISTAQFINYSINGTSYALVAPTANFSQQVYTFTAGGTISNSINIIGGPANTQNFTQINFTQTGIALNSIQTLNNFITPQLSDSARIVTPISVNITEYGAVGEFISGNFSGALTGAPPTNTAYNIVCNFRVRRQQ